MPLDEDLAGRLTRALEGSTSWYDIHRQFRDLVPEGEEERHRALVWAFAYMLISPTDVGWRAREGSPFGAMFEFAAGRMPPRLEDVPDADVTVWLDALEAADDPRLRSRLGDLVWSRRFGPEPHVAARQACEALVALSRDGDWQPMEATQGLVRALELSQELNDSELMHVVVAQMLDVIADELAQHSDRPGTSFSLLRALVDLRPAQRPSSLLALVQQAESVYSADPHHVESAIELQVALVAPDARPGLRVRQVEVWRETARNAEGILRATFLEKALDVARTHGLVDLAKELRVEIQAITEEDLDLKTISADIQIDPAKLEHFHRAFVEFDAWQQSLAAFGAHGPPGGEPDAVEAQVEQQMRDHPLQYLVHKVVLDADLGIPVFHAIDEASHRLAALAQSRWMSTQFWAISAVEVLERIKVTYGRPTHEELTIFFTTDLIDVGMAERIARAFELWWDDRPDECAHLIVPRLEAAVRSLAREAGFPIIREPYAGKPGGVRPLGELLHALRPSFPLPGWPAYLYHLLSDPLGLNLRNVVAHGIRARIERTDAALLLHAAAFLRTLGVQRGPDPPSDA